MYLAGTFIEANYESLNGSNNKVMGSIAKECVKMQFERSVSHKHLPNVQCIGRTFDQYVYYL